MNWKLTRSAIGEPEIVVLDDEDLTWGFSLLAELAREDKTLQRRAEGVYMVEKPAAGREA